MQGEPERPSNSRGAMLQGIERLVDLVGVSSSALEGLSDSGVGAAIGGNDAAALAATHGHFAGTARDVAKHVRPVVQHRQQPHEGMVMVAAAPDDADLSD